MPENRKLRKQLEEAKKQVIIKHINNIYHNTSGRLGHQK